MVGSVGRMGMAVVARGLSNPSTLWMRRQLELLDTDVELVVTTPGHAKLSPQPERTVELLRLPHFLGKVPRMQSVLWQLQLSRLLRAKRVRATLVHYVNVATGFRRVWKASGKPVLVHCHGYDVTWDLKDPETGTPVHHPDYPAVVRDLASHAHFISNSNWTSGQLRDVGVPSERIHLKYFGIDTPPLMNVGLELNRELMILYLGRLVAFKGPLQVMEAFDRAVGWGMNARLVMAGDGPLSDACQDLRRSLKSGDRIDLLGAVSAVDGMELRARADIFTAHNCTGPDGRVEAFGVTNLEASSSGTPVVGTRSGAVPEVVVDGITGILVEPGDVDGHARAFMTLWEHPELRERLGKSGHERARTKFSPDGERERFREILAAVSTH